MTVVSIPRRFYDDHVDRNLPAPPVLTDAELIHWGSRVGTTKRQYRIDADHPDAAELLNDAEHCAHQINWNVYRGLIMSARATIKALKEADRGE